MHVTPPVIEVLDGAVDLGGRPILREIDVTIGEGEVVTLLGANGSGKSTLVRAMLGLNPLARGEVRLFGTPLDEFREHKRVGFVPQRPTAAGGVPATVREVVASGRLSRRRVGAPPSRTDRIAVDRAIGSVGLAARAGDNVSTLSGGQQQRVLIARALAGDPKLLILDEPTAGVDVPSQETFARVLQGLIDHGVTVVLVAHELGPIAPLITRSIVMREGRISYDGPPLAAFHEEQHHHGFHHPELEATHPRDYALDVRSPLEGTL